ncbi:MAG TPA: hypothetical protein PKE55_05765 [Kiritimatiellia bacterium]|nr:hypothetical protein [Kiritimatiellia bacterium]
MISIPLLWLHLLAMVGAFGAILAFQLVVPEQQRKLAEQSRRIGNVVNAMILVGFLTGIGYYLLEGGYLERAHYNGVIAVKFLLLLGVGALVGISKKREMGDSLRWGALALLALAALFARTIRFPDAG